MPLQYRTEECNVSIFDDEDDDDESLEGEDGFLSPSGIRLASVTRRVEKEEEKAAA